MESDLMRLTKRYRTRGFNGADDPVRVIVPKHRIVIALVFL